MLNPYVRKNLTYCADKDNGDYSAVGARDGGEM